MLMSAAAEISRRKQQRDLAVCSDQAEIPCVLIGETWPIDDSVTCDVEPPRRGCDLKAIFEWVPQRSSYGHIPCVS